MDDIIPPDRTPKYNKVMGRHDKRKSHVALTCANDNCNKILYRHHSIINKHSVLVCCTECRKAENVIEKLEEMNAIKGNINPFRTKEGQELAKKRIRQKYGVDNAFQSEEVKEKIKNTMVEKYGVDHPMRSEDIQLKAMKTRIEKYGIENLTGVVPTAKTIQTNREKYSADWFFGSQFGKMNRDTLKNVYGYTDEEISSMYKSKGITIENLSKKMSVEDAEKAVKEWSSKCVNTLDNFIKRHGKDEGTKKYNNYVEKIRKNLQVKRSKIADKCIGEVCDSLPHNVTLNECYYMEREWFIPYEDEYADKHVYFVDFKYKDKIVEFYGDFWHGNPDIFDRDDFNPVIGKTFYEITQQDKIRIKNIESKGYKVYIVWEREYNKNPVNVVKNIIKFIKD